MIFVIGGQAQGKRSYVMNELGFAACDMADGVLDEKPVLYNLQALVSRDPGAAEALLETLLLKKVVVCNEVGCGVVPLSRGERAAREATGRLSVALAARSERVVRVVCGIPTVIKG